MMPNVSVEECAFQQQLAMERPRLVWLCAYLLGDQDAAEDATQEVLFAAWRQRAQLRAPEAAGPWLSGIARNVCAQWWRKHRRVGTQVQWVNTEAVIDHTDDFTVDLERHELALLLDRALALLPEDTRAVLVQKYIEQSSHTAIAAQLGLSENAVAVRLHRGRLALQKLFTTTLHDEAQELGLVSIESAKWQTTRIWCPFCGMQKLLAEIGLGEGNARFWCPDCRQHTTMQIVWTREQALLDSIKNHKPLLSRQLTYCHERYQHALANRVVACPTCNKLTHVNVCLPDHAELSSLYHGGPGVYIDCEFCAWMDLAPLQHLVLDLPQTQHFWRSNGRIRLGREYAIERDGRAALVTTFESVTTAPRLVVITDAETLAVRSIVQEQ